MNTSTWLRIGSTSILFAASSLTLPCSAQDEVEYVGGGLISWPWIIPHTDPLHEGEYLLWTAEDGGRIRFETIDPANLTPTTRTLQEIDALPGAPAFRAILRDIETWTNGGRGVAVGDHATWLWSGSPTSSSATWIQNEVVWDATEDPIGDIRLWDVELHLGTAHVVGEDGLIAYTPHASPLQSNPVRLFPASFPNDDGPTGPMKGIDFIDGSDVRGAAVGLLTFDEGSGSLRGGAYYTDDGQNWLQSDVYLVDTSGVPISPDAETSIELFRIDFVPESLVGYAVGGFGSDAGYLFRTDDAGRSWIQERHECDCVTSGPCYPGSGTCQQPATCGTTSPNTAKRHAVMNGLYGVGSFSDESAVAVGYGGQILVRDITRTGPCMWAEVTNRCEFSTIPLWGVHTDGEDFAVLAGTPEQIRVSTNQGWKWDNIGWEKGWRMQTFTVVPGGSSNGLGTAWWVGQQCRVARSTDGGETWTDQHAKLTTPDSGRRLNDVAVRDDGDSNPDNDIGLAVGAKVTGSSPWTLLGTITGGSGSNCWDLKSGPSGPSATNLNSVECAGTTSGGAVLFWITGDDGVLLRTTYASSTWTTVSFSASSVDSGLAGVDWRDATFRDVDTGWVIGFDSSLGAVTYATTNGSGATPTWTAMTMPSGKVFNRIRSTANACVALAFDGSLWSVSGSGFASVSGPTTAEVPDTLEIVDDSTSTDILLGGALGEFFRGTGSLSSPMWTEHRSLTTIAITGIHFLTSDLGYLFGGPEGLEIEGGGANSFTRWNP